MIVEEMIKRLDMINTLAHNLQKDLMQSNVKTIELSTEDASRILMCLGWLQTQYKKIYINE